jgi:hypothetical protein|tara:strand:- start:1051 stop:1557 length:507 start_codon:yes stop_codon:yes gene_type:complete
VPTIDELKEEACKFREFIESCDKENTKLVIDCFPIMSCKLSSMLLSYHFLELWRDLEIKGISASTGKNGQITHYWLEINDVVIDITGDQYNLINDSELNKAIVKNRPFEVVHVANKAESYLYDLFKILETDSLVYGFPSIGEDFIEDMELGYNQLLNQATCSNNSGQK